MHSGADTRRRQAPRAGWTLVELLVALSVAAVVMGIATLLYRAASSGWLGQQRRSREALLATALEEVARDLACHFPTALDEACALAISPGPDASSAFAEARFCATVAAAGELEGARVEGIRYAVRTGRGSGLLLRESGPRAGAHAGAYTATNAVLEGLTAFRLSVYDGSAWRDRWPPEETGARPLAVRIELAIGSGERERGTLEVPLAVSQVYTSRLERAGGGSP